MAEFQYVTEPYRLVIDYEIPDDYTKTRELIKEWLTEKKIVMPTSCSPKKAPPAPAPAAASEEGKGNGGNNLDEGDDESNKGVGGKKSDGDDEESNNDDGGKKSDSDDESGKDTSGKGDVQNAMRKLKFDPANAVIRFNGELVKGSEEEDLLEWSKRVTDIHYPVVPQFLRLKGLKAQNVDEVEANASRLLKMMKQKDPIEAEEFEKATVPWPRETKKCDLKQRL